MCWPNCLADCKLDHKTSDLKPNLLTYMVVTRTIWRQANNSVVTPFPKYKTHLRHTYENKSEGASQVINRSAGIMGIVENKQVTARRPGLRTWHIYFFKKIIASSLKAAVNHGIYTELVNSLWVLRCSKTRKREERNVYTPKRRNMLSFWLVRCQHRFPRNVWENMIQCWMDKALEKSRDHQPMTASPPVQPRIPKRRLKAAVQNSRQTHSVNCLLTTSVSHICCDLE